MTNNDVSGNSAITNLADNVLSIEKPNIRVLKNRDFGITGYILCSYNPVNRRIFQTSVGDRTCYGWEHKDIKVPEDQAIKCEEFRIQNGVPDEEKIFPF